MGKGKAPARILAVLLILVLLLSLACIVMHAGHDCCGERCLVCACLEVCRQVLFLLALSAAPLFGCPGPGSLLRRGDRSAPAGLCPATPVSLKVRLSS